MSDCSSWFPLICFDTHTHTHCLQRVPSQASFHPSNSCAHSALDAVSTFFWCVKRWSAWGVLSPFSQIQRARDDALQVTQRWLQSISCWLIYCVIMLVGSPGLWHYVLLLIFYYGSLELISMAAAVRTITTTRRVGDMWWGGGGGLAHTLICAGWTNGPLALDSWRWAN